jgi:predicted nucleotidyltransferase
MKTAIFTEAEQELLDLIVSIVKEHADPKRIILFGSRATGKGREYSDFDIAVEGVEMSIRKERLLKEALDQKLGIYTVDLIDLDKVDPEFRKLIMEQGRVIYEKG